MTRTDDFLPAEVPDYQLYRENVAGTGHFHIHCEPLHTRSRLYRWEIDLHRHDTSFQLFAIETGGGEVTFGDGYRRFEAPVVLYLPAGAVHGFRFSAGSDGQVLTVLADRLQNTFASERPLMDFYSVPRILHQHGDGWPATHGRLAEIAKEMATPAPGALARSAALLSIVLVDLARDLPLEQTIATANSASRDEARMAALQALVSRHFRTRQRTEFYAGQFGLSVQQINRICRHSTGRTVQQLAADRVLAEAKHQLVSGFSPIREIAESLGFADPAYFNRFFRKQTGQSPGEFRRQGNGEERHCDVG